MQSDVAQPVLSNSLPRGPEHRLGNIDRDDAAMLADRRGERLGQRPGAAADFEHALAAAEAQPRQQQREAFLVAPLPESWRSDPARPGDGIPIAALRRIRIESFLGHCLNRPFFLCRKPARYYSGLQSSSRMVWPINPCRCGCGCGDCHIDGARIKYTFSAEAL